MTKPSPQHFIFDSWPIVEWLKGRQTVIEKLSDLNERARRGDVSFAISRINLGEVVYLGRKELRLPIHTIDTFLQTFYRLSFEVASVSDQRVDAAVDLKAKYNISYADAFAAALAIERNAPLVTGDKELRALEADGLLRLHWLGA